MGGCYSKREAYADEIYKQLKEEYEAYTSEEYFIDLCDINGWRFDQRHFNRGRSSWDIDQT
jgi:hypothetical protein